MSGCFPTCASPPPTCADTASAHAPTSRPSSAAGRASRWDSLYFFTYSSFMGKPILWLEDLVVLPNERGQGAGKAILQALARIAVKRGCGRMEWSVLDWNAPAIR